MSALSELYSIIRIQDYNARDLAYQRWAKTWLVQVEENRALNRFEAQNAHLQKGKESELVKSLSSSVIQECAVFELIDFDLNADPAIPKMFPAKIRYRMIGIRALPKNPMLGSS